MTPSDCLFGRFLYPSPSPDPPDPNPDGAGGVSLQNLKATIQFVASRHPGAAAGQPGSGEDATDVTDVTDATAVGGVGVEMPILQRSNSSLADAFAQSDLDGGMASRARALARRQRSPPSNTSL